mmetsp:Transcript_8458/g.19613  ORF Transcript_8458/g.19613 Transcript_8458/m.19613 type:complete len:82 (+) Transcript_8458:245-490(+)
MQSSKGLLENASDDSWIMARIQGWNMATMVQKQNTIAGPFKGRSNVIVVVIIIVVNIVHYCKFLFASSKIETILAQFETAK